MTNHPAVRTRQPAQATCRAKLAALSNADNLLSRQCFSADAPITASRFFYDDHGLVSKAFALDADERIGDLLDHLSLLRVRENSFDQFDGG